MLHVITVIALCLKLSETFKEELFFSFLADFFFLPNAVVTTLLEYYNYYVVLSLINDLSCSQIVPLLYLFA